MPLRAGNGMEGEAPVSVGPASPGLGVFFVRLGSKSRPKLLPWEPRTPDLESTHGLEARRRRPVEDTGGQEVPRCHADFWTRARG